MKNLYYNKNSITETFPPNHQLIKNVKYKGIKNRRVINNISTYKENTRTYKEPNIIQQREIIIPLNWWHPKRIARTQKSQTYFRQGRRINICDHGLPKEKNQNKEKYNTFQQRKKLSTGIEHPRNYRKPEKNNIQQERRFYKQIIRTPKELQIQKQGQHN